MPGLSKYCDDCGLEIPDEGTTMYEGKEVCECEGEE